MGVNGPFRRLQVPVAAKGPMRSMMRRQAQRQHSTNIELEKVMSISRARFWIAGSAAALLLLGSSGSVLADAVWDAADKACKGAGADCCAVADANGNPKKTDGVQHCSCGQAIAQAGPITTLAQRQKLTSSRGMRKTLAPASNTAIPR